MTGRNICETRICRRCLEVKLIGEFPLSPNGNHGWTCDECRKRQKRESGLNTTGRPHGSIHKKVCRRCGDEKPEQAFIAGFDVCRQCQRERRRKWEEDLR